MELVFPFKNTSVNTLWGFREDEFLERFFINFKQKKDSFYKDLIRDEIELFINGLPDFENELLQFINTSNQRTIDFLFEELKDDCSWVCDINKEEILKDLNEKNTTRNNEFQEKIEKKVEEFFKHENRQKYQHLEEYGTYSYGGLFGISLGQTKPGELQKNKKTNYNFYCVEEEPNLFDLTYFEDYLTLLNKLTSEFQKVSFRYIERFDKGEIVASEKNFYDKTVLYVEGQHDIDLITCAAQLLNKTEILNQVELRQRGGFRNLDKIWKFYKENSVEVSGQIKILLYDCDTEKQDEDFGYIYKRTIPTFEGHIISKGIENLFNNITTQNDIRHKKELIDFKSTKGTKRGVEYYEEINEVNKEEKANFCKWICETGNEKDFANFSVIFDMIEEIITNANN